VPKNLLLIAGAAAIAQTGIPAGQQAAALAVFTVIASLGVAAPVVISFALAERSTGLLARLKEWMARSNNVIMAVRKDAAIGAAVLLAKERSSDRDLRITVVEEPALADRFAPGSVDRSAARPSAQYFRERAAQTETYLRRCVG
jgi:hypothetical protein